MIAIHMARLLGVLSLDTGKPTRDVARPFSPERDGKGVYVHRDDLRARLNLKSVGELFKGAGIQHFTPYEALRLPEHIIDGTIAIPTIDIAKVLTKTFWHCDEIRRRFGRPLSARGYRPPAYNRAVGGARFSQHIEGRAADLRSVDNGHHTRVHLAMTCARFWLECGQQLKMGLGIYRETSKDDPSHVHVDFGSRARVWGDAYHWIKKARRG